MFEDDEETLTGSPLRDAAARLHSVRWLVLAALAGILLVAVEAELPWIAASVAAALVVVIAAFVPVGGGLRRRNEPLVADAGQQLTSVSGEDLAASVPDPLIVFDANAVVVHVNPAASTAFPGLAPGVSLSLRVRAPEMQALIDRLIAERSATAMDYAERLPVERWYRVSGSPVGSQGKLFVLVFKDLSETRRIDRMRADFIANASHELRTPLASISGFIETLRGPARNDVNARDKFLQIMQAQTERMARLISDLLSLSRLEMKPYVGTAETVDLKPLIDGVIDALRPLWEESGLTVERQLGEGPALVVGSRDEMIQVFSNLVENACKYGQGGGRVEVTLTRPATAGGMIEVVVRDFGPGIAEEHIPRLTERFYRADVETSRGQQGTGLGLAIVKHILTRHHGRLTIRSQPGEGAAFTAHIPAA